MLIFKIRKSGYAEWYQRNKERISAKRKKLYAENQEYREQRIEASRRYRRGEHQTSAPPTGAIFFSEAAKRLDIGISTLHEWRRRKYFPEPGHHNSGLWLTENQLNLLKDLKAHLQRYRMWPWNLKEKRWKEIQAFIRGNWS